MKFARYFFVCPWTGRYLISMTLIALFPLCSRAVIYARVDDDGKLLISTQREDIRYRRFDPWHKNVPARMSSDVAIAQPGERFSELIEVVAREVGVNPHLLHAVIQVESAYDPRAVSSKGAQGLMQLIPATASRYRVLEPQDPASNIRAGAQYLKALLHKFDHNLPLALAAYNAGEGTVQRYHNSVPPFPETEAYVQHVLTIFEQRLTGKQPRF